MQLYLLDYDNCFTKHLKDINIAVPAVRYVSCEERKGICWLPVLYKAKNKVLMKYLRLESLAAMGMNIQIFCEMTLFQFAHIYEFSGDLATSIFMVKWLLPVICKLN